MGLIACQSDIIEGLNEFNIVPLETESITEVGNFIVYEGSRFSSGYLYVEREFALYVVGMSLSSESGLLPVVERIEACVFDLGVETMPLTLINTKLISAESGLFIYRVGLNYKEEL